MLKTLAFAAALLYGNADIITQESLDGALHRINPADKFQNIKMKGQTTSTSKGSLTYKTMQFQNTTIDNSAVNVIEGTGNVSLVVDGVAMKIPPTQFTANSGIMHCSGVLHGVITGAAAAAKAVVSVVDDLDMKMTSPEAGLLQDAIVTVEHTLDGLCGLIEDLLKGLLMLIGGLINDLLGTVIPDIVQGMLGELVKDALGMGEKYTILSKTVPIALPTGRNFTVSGIEYSFS